MAMRASTAALAAAAATAPRGGFLRLFSTTSTSSSSFPFLHTTQQTPAREQAEPNTNLFVSGVEVWKGILNTVFAEFLQWRPSSGLSKRTTSEGLREAFSKFGEVVQARVVSDRVSGYSKGFGFVKYATLEDAAEGIKGMDGQLLKSWNIL
ncbi:hypothetical protein OIU77_008826 [Salix suchowensis]|uniref:RRM domain-containing protein n=1 Tax=Salix suchowensis TaxID=1278906 RepID=A0ABQ9ADH5_9ROSI|nr:hypothetical protein OIU77_008826 [Salix suchowensis]